MNKEVVIYGTKACPFCHKARDFMKAHNINFKYVLVDEDDKARDMMIEKSGQMSVPVIMIGDEVIVGYDEEKFKKALGLEG